MEESIEQRKHFKYNINKISRNTENVEFFLFTDKILKHAIRNMLEKS